MLTPLHEVLDLLLRSGASYADVRHVENERENLRVRNDEVEGLHQVRDAGYGLRVLVDGAWGFSSSARGTREALERAAREAIEIARAAARIAKDAVSLAPSSPAKGSYRTRVLRDPFTVPIEEKLELLFSATRILRADPRVRAARGSMTFVRQRKHLVSSEGHDVAQDITISGGGIAAVAVEGTDAQSRSYPKDGEGDIAQAGYEFVVGLELAGNAERVREEAIALLSAPDCPAGAKTLVLTGSQLSLQVHESCGHPTELDRALGTELSLAGGSFLTPDRLGMRYGASHVHMVAEATTPGAPGSFGWDDEGTPARKVDLVRGGEFVGYLSSRETAARIGATSSGAVRAESWNRVPLIRMVNVNLEPGPTDTRLDDLVADTDDGLLLDVNRAWSIDDRRLNFQFGVEAAWELKHGRRTRLLRNTIYTGITPRFWQSCDAIAGPDDWRMWGWMFCGKGDPMQVIWVGHGVSAARFRSVDVGSRR